ncbi:flavodoxin [Alkalicella caledoniensis]|uniref:Flavodoxin n=1 Tax=Alkalicella caledoniensis TaxID=2731377 RepID=A0A7G9W9Z5_ALKCA|nr:flavodoxin domain-containing protein [Alkalicella caledoniensis]QNO15507.1 flavodoxin [Alkalicella caledoniensis]
MRTLIVYSTKYGTTEKCARILSEKLGGNTTLHNLKVSGTPDTNEFDTIIIGGSIYVGQMIKEVTDFCSNNTETLKNKKLGLFICCMRDKELAEQQLSTLYPKELLDKAMVKDYFGGEFIFSKMSFVDKLIAKVVAKAKEDVSTISEEKISSFANKIKAFA